MRIAVTGSIATDYLMTFPGRISEQLVPDQLDRVSLSFLVDELEVRRGGVAANIAFGLALFGQRPVLVGAVGEDFNTDYRAWLDRHGVDTSGVHVSELKHTARFLCTTDDDQNQIASFYTGAMEEARFIELGPIAQRLGGLDMVVVSPNDPTAMLRHTEECREQDIAFMADPGQQIARMPGSDVRKLVDGAAVLIMNDYEKALLERKTGWGDDEVLKRVDVRVTTLGPKGCLLEREGDEPVRVEAVPERRRTDPTGMGDAFRSGFLAGQSWQLDLERCAQLGSLTATYVLEHVGTQEYGLERTSFLDRFRTAYGRDAASELEDRLTIR
ncbi:carbohydrate kinase family protein [Salsipaludibacter albus]|uniref:carbohydrate kinase family protein n=1 Tax=Salsipaludibacter albus TaxID=2849650 RepID=UPI001EE3BBA9|nr:carbohydrate kinase family protein [Salsipaludibacter albus]MBY5161624.1 carbohydrate kinase family protein [Salsipaludibacter albus]